MIDDDLHAKVYIADDTLAIITSANFTKGGLKINKEVGLKFELDNANQLLPLLDEWFDEAKPPVGDGWFEDAHEGIRQYESTKREENALRQKKSSMKSSILKGLREPKSAVGSDRRRFREADVLDGSQIKAIVRNSFLDEKLGDCTEALVTFFMIAKNSLDRAIPSDGWGRVIWNAGLTQISLKLDGYIVAAVYVHGVTLAAGNNPFPEQWRGQEDVDEGLGPARIRGVPACDVGWVNDQKVHWDLFAVECQEFFKK